MDPLKWHEAPKNSFGIESVAYANSGMGYGRKDGKFLLLEMPTCTDIINSIISEHETELDMRHDFFRRKADSRF